MNNIFQSMLDLFKGNEVIGDLSVAGDTLMNFIFSDHEVLANLPGISLLNGFYNIYDKARAGFLYVKSLYFFSELNKGNLSQDQINAYLAKLESKEKLQEELNHILIYLDSFTRIEKSELLAKCFKARIKYEISEEEFKEFSDIIKGLFLEDLPTLYFVRKEKNIDTYQVDSSRINRLDSLGLVDKKWNTHINIPKDQHYFCYPTSSGRKFSDIIFKDYFYDSKLLRTKVAIVSEKLLHEKYSNKIKNENFVAFTSLEKLDLFLEENQNIGLLEIEEDIADTALGVEVITIFSDRNIIPYEIIVGDGFKKHNDLIQYIERKLPEAYIINHH